ncbi:MAG: porin family protein [Flavobacteriales bacterium]|nr:porin family protein [Flavobacteriales bacterium]MCW8913682.1 porin family protein [Flavobacteriales bacterium]MCW8937854.1 porin family protein [Flavobacteriales bacterium]MCW8940827.1 porin family protein [Flavobacteriales bacterium]MCW8967286.1 porin family protein [Flavobacteriales bacterium]
MKKTPFYLATIMLLMLSITSIKTNAQAFQKGNWNIDIDLGLGIYATETTTSVKANAFGFNINESDTETDGTASSIFRIGAEYGISNKFGLGIKIGASNYFIDEEDKDTLKSVKSTDFAIHCNYHLLNADKNDLFITLGLGIVNANWEYQDIQGAFLKSAKGNGGYFTLGVTDRIFFSDNIGMLFSINFPFMNINIDPELSDDVQSALNSFNVNYELDMKMRLRGVYLGTGLAIKF